MLRDHSSPGNREARRRAPAGFTLAEVLVAVAVFAVVSAIALTLYQQLQKSFKAGENATAQQQNTRIAFDRLIADLRMAGFNFNPDGDMARPDEQIEGMWQHALTIRGDFDFETSDAATPESSLGGTGMPFGIVSTGNDEIVTYALGKPSGVGGVSIQFQADVGQVPRDGTVETVTINNIYLDMNSPPYTLYRIVLKPAGAPLSNMGDKQPVADNIRSLEFTYYDDAGNVLSTMVGGMDTTTAIEERDKIAKIGVEIIGMTQDPDRNYVDPTDTNPLSRSHRKFVLASDVRPRNLDYVGRPDLDLTDPNMPSGLQVCPGHCEGLWTTWNANAPEDGVVKYEVTTGTSIMNMGNARDAFGTSLYVDALDPNGSYIVGLTAVDVAGNKSQTLLSGSTAMSEITTPGPPSSMTVTSIGAGNALESAIDIGWSAPAVNVSGPTCDQDPNGDTPLRDLDGYMLYRGATGTFDPNVASEVQNSWDPNTLTGGDPDPNFTDKTVVNCRTYYYKAVAEDLCGVHSSVAASGGGTATSATPPEAPLNVAASNTGPNAAKITWDPVVLNTSGNAVVIDTYKVWRATVPGGHDPNLAIYSLLYDGPVAAVGTPEYTDTNMPVPTVTDKYYYRISARDDCPNESAASFPAMLTSCTFGGSIYVDVDPGGSVVSGTQSIVVTVDPTITPVQATLTIRDWHTGLTVYSQTSSVYPFTFAWNSSSVPPGWYGITATVTDDQGCTDTLTLYVQAALPAVCCITAANPTVTNNSTLGTIGGGQNNNQVSFSLLNLCTTDVVIEAVKMDWQDIASTSPQLGGWMFQGYPDMIFVPPLNPISGLSPVADFDLLNDPSLTPYTISSGATATASYIFTKAMAWKIGFTRYGNVMQVQYEARQPNAARQTCFITVTPDVTAPGLVLCDPTLDPNCPGF